MYFTFTLQKAELYIIICIFHLKMRKKETLFRHTSHSSQSIKCLWMTYVQIKNKHISKWKIELKDNKEGKYRLWVDKDEIKNLQITDFETQL